VLLLYYSCVSTLTQILNEQLQAKEEVLNFNIETRKQMQTAIDEITRREETNNRTIQELREEQKQLVATIDDLTKTMEPDVSTCKLEAVTSSKWSEKLPAIILVKFRKNTDVS
jgi:predicted translin family RNA/ssDNA-binding protein